MKQRGFIIIFALVLIMAGAVLGFFFMRGSNEVLVKNEVQETAYLPAETPEVKSAKILFVGDLMFDRKIRQAAQKNGNDYIFGGISEFLKQQDLVVANLEGPITDNKSVSVNSMPGSDVNYVFTFDPSLAKTLFEQNIRLVSLGNNHILNFGQKGLEQTKQYLGEAQVSYFGDPAQNGTTGKVAEINDIKIGFAGYDQFNSNSSSTLAQIEDLKGKVNFIVVYAHWGTEYVKTANRQIVALAHLFIDKGADLIIGSHPHVIQDKEEYKNKTIYYSLGNFIFDQWFDSEVNHGLGVIATIYSDKSSVYEEVDFFLEKTGQTLILKP